MADKKAAAGKQAVMDFLQANRVLFAGTMGFDKTPQVRPVEFGYEEDGAFYFAAAKCETYYGEVSQYPQLVLCGYDAKSGRVLTIKGEAVFTEDEAAIAKNLEACKTLQKKWGKDPKMVIAYFLKDMTATLSDLAGETIETIEFGTPENVLIGITIEKDTEIKDRLVKIMTRREAETPAPSGEAEVSLQKLYDGAVLYFAEKAKEVWPRMDIRPIESSAMFETYDEREKYTGLAKKLIGNARITKPEDLTYYLNKETLAELSGNQ